MICKTCRHETPDNSIYCMVCGTRLIKARDPYAAITVPLPQKLKSGNFRIQLRKEGISITKPTAEECRKAALAAKRKWLEDEAAGKHIPPPPKLALADAMDTYIASKDNVLSPTTIRAYKSMREHRFRDCMSWDLNDSSLNWQMAVNKEATEVKPQSLANAWHLIATVFKFHRLTPPRVTLPKKIKSDRPYLRYDQLVDFLKAMRGEDVELGALLALSSLRRSEVLALKPSDISPDGKTISIHAARVLNTDNELVYRETNKTEKSSRVVQVAVPRLQELLVEAAKSDSEYIFDWSGKRFHDHIDKVCRKAGLPEVGIHGLRHSFASLGYHLDLKKMTVMDVGGWSDSHVVDDVYTHNADLDDDVKRMREFYESLFS